MEDITRRDQVSIAAPRTDTKWPPPTGAYPNPSIEIFFAGTMGFYYNPSTRECEIGVHSASASHKLQVFVYEGSKLIYGVYALPDSSKFELGIESKPAQVYFHQAPGEIDRTDPVDRTDFRWLIDFEHRDFYNRRLTLNSGIYLKRIHIQHGIFFADCTYATFDVVGGPREQVGIHVARLVRNQIALAANECVTIKWNNHNVVPPLCYKPGVKYQVFFLNLCRKRDGSVCPDNDFYLNFDAVQIPPNERFELLLNHASHKDGIYGITGITATDDAPCMGTGYGQGGGLPTYPPG